MTFGCINGFNVAFLYQSTLTMVLKYRVCCNTVKTLNQQHKNDSWSSPTLKRTYLFIYLFILVDKKTKHSQCSLTPNK